MEYNLEQLEERAMYLEHLEIELEFQIDNYDYEGDLLERKERELEEVRKELDEIIEIFREADNG